MLTAEPAMVPLKTPPLYSSILTFAPGSPAASQVIA